MTIRDALSKASAALTGGQREAIVILSDKLGRDKAYLYAHLDELLDYVHRISVEEAVALRSQGMPLQYVLGRTEFMSLDFRVNSDVLIPRPETEILVEAVLELCSGMTAVNLKSDKIEVLDLGTGSGCIAVSIAHHFPKCMVTASDISASALETARCNARLNGVEDKVRFVVSDFFDAFGGVRFDIIVSNPPYIASSEIPLLQPEVRGFEPHLALDGGDDGLYCLKRIIDGSVNHLKPGGWLALEIGKGQSSEILDYMRSQAPSQLPTQSPSQAPTQLPSQAPTQLPTQSEIQHFSTPGFLKCHEVVKDLAGIDRVVFARI